MKLKQIKAFFIGANTTFYPKLVIKRLNEVF